jgi:hypothetical protein
VITAALLSRLTWEGSSIAFTAYSSLSVFPGFEHHILSSRWQAVALSYVLMSFPFSTFQLAWALVP